MTGPQFEVGTASPQVIVVGIDGTESSLRAAAYAMGVARRHNAQLIVAVVVAGVLRAATYSAVVAAAVGVAVLPAVVEGHLNFQQRLVRDLTADATAWRAQFELVVRCGNPSTQLAETAQQAAADMVVIGASSSLARRASRSLPRRLYRQRRWAVTIVP